MAEKIKAIDEIDDLVEMFHAMTALGISCHGLTSLEQMKDRAKDALKEFPSTLSWTAGQAFSVLSRVKDEDAEKREILSAFYYEVKKCYGELDDKTQALLLKNIGNVTEKMENHQIRLGQKDYYLLVAGETGSGKSSLVNLILGEELLPYSVLSTTSTICELRYGEVRRIVVHFKVKDTETGLQTKSFHLVEPSAEASKKSFLEQISPYVHLKSDREKGSIYKKVEIYWPHRLLKNGVVIVDSPGVGESDIMDEIVTEYLPQAFAFVYVINSANAGGVQTDRLGKLLEGVEEKRKEGEFPSTCALFVCNKWDQVPERETKEVEDYVIRQLRKFYPEIVPGNQIVQMSTANANIAQNHGIVTEDFITLMDCMRSMILRGIKARFETYWRWLYGVLSQIVYTATAHVKNALRDQEKATKVMAFILLRLTRIDAKQSEVMEHLHNYLKRRTSDAVNSLAVHLRSNEVRSHFTSWSLDDAPKAETSWEVTNSKITKVMQSRLQEIIEHWEEDNHVFASTRDSLVQHFRERYNFLEGELRNLQGAVLSDDLVIENDHPVDAGLTFTTTEKVAIGITSPLWFPLSLVALVISAPVVGVMAIKSKLENRSKILKYEKDKCAFMKEASADYLNDVTTGDLLTTFVKEQLKEANICLKQIEARIPELIEADKILCKQLQEEKRPAKEIKEIYEPIVDTASEIRGRLAVFALEEGLSAGISVDTLDLKGQSECLGWGAFASVYKGMMKTENGEKQTVALKTYTKPLTAENACDIVNEIELLKKLKHPNVVNFHGTSLLKDDGDDGETHVILVMEYCTGNLKDRIFKNPERAPANSKNANAKRDACRWIKQITAALTFIHDQKVVHRDLKLDNILLSAENVAKITDVGVSKAVEHITGTLAGTPVYMAPEVFHSQLYDSKADIYSLGIILWEMWYGQQAFSGVRNVLNLVSFFATVDAGLRPINVEGCNQPPRRWEELMQSCWRKKAGKRPSASHCRKEAIKLYNEAVPELP